MPGIGFLERLQGRLTSRVDASSDSAPSSRSVSRSSAKDKRPATAEDSSKDLSPQKKLSRSKSPVPETFIPDTPASTAGSAIVDAASTGTRGVHAVVLDFSWSCVEFSYAIKYCAPPTKSKRRTCAGPHGSAAAEPNTAGLGNCRVKRQAWLQNSKAKKEEKRKTKQEQTDPSKAGKDQF